MSIDANSIIAVLRMMKPVQLINFKKLIFSDNDKKSKFSDEDFILTL